MSPCADNRRRIDQYYGYLCPRFRSVNKFLYAMLCVHHRCISEYMRDEYWDVVSKVYSISLKGRPGRNVALDHLQEKINKRGKQSLDGVITGDRVSKIIPTLNATHPIETAYMNMMHNEGGRRAHMGVRSKEDEIASVTRYLQLNFAANYHQVTVQRDWHPLLDREDTLYRRPRAAQGSSCGMLYGMLLLECQSMCRKSAID